MAPADRGVRGAAPSGASRTPWRTLGIDTRRGRPCCLRGHAQGPGYQRYGTAGRSARELLWVKGWSSRPRSSDPSCSRSSRALVG